MVQPPLTGQPERTGRGFSLGCGLFLVGALLVVGGLAYAGWTWIVTPKPSDEPLSERVFTDGCSWPRKYFPKAAAYDGDAPHPVEVVIKRDSAGGGYYSSMLLVSSDIAKRVPPYLNPRDEARVQLLACLEPADEGRQVRTCTFDSGEEVPLYEATYDVTVYEARTGREVGTATIPAAVSASCPMILTWDENEDPKVLTEPSLTQVREALAEFTGE